jgi:hypothetical protein
VSGPEGKVSTDRFCASYPEAWILVVFKKEKQDDSSEQQRKVLVFQSVLQSRLCLEMINILRIRQGPDIKVFVSDSNVVTGLNLWK